MSDVILDEYVVFAVRLLHWTGYLLPPSSVTPDFEDWSDFLLLEYAERVKLFRRQFGTSPRIFLEVERDLEMSCVVSIRRALHSSASLGMSLISKKIPTLEPATCRKPLWISAQQCQMLWEIGPVD